MFIVETAGEPGWEAAPEPSWATQWGYSTTAYSWSKPDR